MAMGQAGPWWALVGLRTGPLCGPHANKRKEAGWGNSARKGLEERNPFFLFKSFDKLQTNLNSNQI
jgi:hypothetical protein